MLTDLRTYIVSQDTTGMDSARATALTAIRAAIGGRMFPDVPDEGISATSLSYQLIDDSLGHVLVGTNDGLYRARVQIDVWAFDPITRESVSDNLVIALDGFMGTIGTTPIGILLWDNGLNMYEPDRKYYRKVLDFKVLHN